MDVKPEEEEKETRPGMPLASSRTDVSAFGQQLPFFQAQGLFEENTGIPKNRVSIHHIDMYSPPPLGQSLIEEFNPTAHLILENPEGSEEENDFNPYEEVEEDPLKYKVAVEKVD